MSERSAWKALICAIIERAADDVRAMRRQGMIDDDGTLIETHNPTLPGAGHSGREGCRVPALDALRFFEDGRLERMVDLINSPSLHADRMRAHIFSPAFKLDKGLTSQMGR